MSTHHSGWVMLVRANEVIKQERPTKLIEEENTSHQLCRKHYFSVMIGMGMLGQFPGYLDLGSGSSHNDVHSYCALL